MHAGPHASGPGTWIWLPTAAFSAAVVVAVVTSYGGGGCKARAQASPAATASGHRASTAPAAAHARPPAAASGIALYYDPGTAPGSCSMGPFPAGGYYASLPPQQYGDGAACGTYLDVRGPKGAVRAEVVDLCPGCSATTINLSRSAFDRIADPTPGSAPVTYWRAVNPPLEERLELRVVGGPVDGGLSLQILHHGNALASVAVSAASAAQAGGAPDGAADPGPSGAPSPAAPGAGAGSAGPGSPWQSLARAPNGFWASTKPLGPGFYDVRLVDVLGHEVVLTHLDLAPGAVVWSRRRMYPLTATTPPRPRPRPSRPASGAGPAAAGGCRSK